MIDICENFDYDLSEIGHKCIIFILKLIWAIFNSYFVADRANFIFINKNLIKIFLN